MGCGRLGSNHAIANVMIAESNFLCIIGRHIGTVMHPTALASFSCFAADRSVTHRAFIDPLTGHQLLAIGCFYAKSDRLVWFGDDTRDLVKLPQRPWNSNGLIRVNAPKMALFTNDFVHVWPRLIESTARHSESQCSNRSPAAGSPKTQTTHERQ